MREDQRVGSCELKTGAFPGGQDLFRFRARHFGASAPVRIKIKKWVCVPESHVVPPFLSLSLTDLKRPAVSAHWGNPWVGEAENESKAPSESSGSRPHLPAPSVSSCPAPRRPPATHRSALCSWDLEGQPRGRQMVKETWGVLFAVFLFVFLIIQVKSAYILVK